MIRRSCAQAQKNGVIKAQAMAIPARPNVRKCPEMSDLGRLSQLGRLIETNRPIFHKQSRPRAKFHAFIIKTKRLRKKRSNMTSISMQQAPKPRCTSNFVPAIQSARIAGPPISARPVLGYCPKFRRFLPAARRHSAGLALPEFA